MKLVQSDPVPIIHMGMWYIRFNVPGRKHAEKRPTGYPADIEVPKELHGKRKPMGWHATWWQQSKYAEQLKLAIKDAEKLRDAIKAGKPLRTTTNLRSVLTWEQLLAKYEASQQLINGRLPASEKEKIENAIATLLRFDSKIRPSLVNDKWAGRWRSWAESVDPLTGSRRYAPATLAGYVQRINKLMSFAVKPKYRYALENPFDEIKISVPVTRHKFFFTEDEFVALEVTARANIEAFSQIYFLRTHGYRIVESSRFQLYELDFRREVIDTDRVKMQREDVFPFYDITWLILENQPHLRPLIDKLRKSKGMPEQYREIYLFKYRAKNIPNEVLTAACAEAGVPVMNAKHLKKNYGREIQEQTGKNESVYNLMMHHIPKGMNKVGITHYTGPNLVLMKEIAQAAFNPEWLQFGKDMYKKYGGK
jgi:hypothetical protein